MCRWHTEVFNFSSKRWAVSTGPILIYSSMRGGTTFSIKSFEPNEWWLYDMVGNVREWCVNMNIMHMVPLPLGVALE